MPWERKRRLCSAPDCISVGDGGDFARERYLPASVRSTTPCFLPWNGTSLLPIVERPCRYKEGDNLQDDRTLFALLAESGVIDGRFDLEAFKDLVETAPSEIFRL